MTALEGPAPQLEKSCVVIVSLSLQETTKRDGHKEDACHEAHFKPLFAEEETCRRSIYFERALHRERPREKR